jgi:hypothetical protein
LRRLEKEIRSPGYAHMGEIDMRILAAAASELSLRNLLEVVAVNQGWSADILERAQAAMAHGMLFGPQRQKVAYWHELVKLALEYNGRRSLLFKVNLRVVSRD